MTNRKEFECWVLSEFDNFDKKLFKDFNAEDGYSDHNLNELRGGWVELIEEERN